MSNKFEVALKEKFRYPYKGQIATEDLFDLSIEGLDAVFKSLNSQVKKANEESLLNTKTKEDDLLDMKLSIVKYVFNQKVLESQKRALERETKIKKDKLMTILANKQDEQLHGMSVEELQKMINDLG